MVIASWQMPFCFRHFTGLSNDYIDRQFQSFLNNSSSQATSSSTRAASKHCSADYRPGEAQEIFFSILYISGVFLYQLPALNLFSSLVSLFITNILILEMAFIISPMLLFVSSALNPLICLWRVNDTCNCA